MDHFSLDLMERLPKEARQLILQYVIHDSAFDDAVKWQEAKEQAQGRMINIYSSIYQHQMMKEYDPKLFLTYFDKDANNIAPMLDDAVFNIVFMGSVNLLHELQWVIKRFRTKVDAEYKLPHPRHTAFDIDNDALKRKVLSDEQCWQLHENVERISKKQLSKFEDVLVSENAHFEFSSPEKLHSRLTAVGNRRKSHKTSPEMMQADAVYKWREAVRLEMLRRDRLASMAIFLHEHLVRAGNEVSASIAVLDETDIAAKQESLDGLDSDGGTPGDEELSRDEDTESDGATTSDGETLGSEDTVSEESLSEEEFEDEQSVIEEESGSEEDEESASEGGEASDEETT